MSKKQGMTDLNHTERNFINSYFDETIEEGPKSFYSELVYTEGRYEQLEKMASGGMKEVFRCLDTSTNREVAKAVLIEDQDVEATEDFLREARITARLQHPNIIPIYDIAIDEKGKPFFTMKIVEGQSLRDYRRQSLPLHLSQRVGLIYFSNSLKYVRRSLTLTPKVCFI